MSYEGWYWDVISNNLLAYKKYKKLNYIHSDWHSLANALNVSNLIEFSRSKRKALEYDSLKY